MISSVVDSFRQWRDYRDTVEELSRLSNRDLNDLGISRAEIGEIAKSAITK